MNLQKLYLLIFFVIIFIPISTNIADENNFSSYVESFSQGKVDWNNGLIYGVGRSYIDGKTTKIRALKTARVIASGNILKLAAGLKLDDRTTMESFGKDKVTIKLSAFLKIQKEEKKWVDDPVRPYYEITQIASIKGIEGLTSKLVSHFKSEPVDQASSFVPSGKTQDLNDEDKPWLVLDARKLTQENPVEPAIFPKIVTRMGETVYSLPQVNETALIKRGMASYVTSDKTTNQLQSKKGPGAKILEDLNALLFPTPAYADDTKKQRRKRQKFIVKEVKEAQGLLNTNIIISASDARQLKSEDASSQILENCRVIVVVSSSISGIEGKSIKSDYNRLAEL